MSARNDAERVQELLAANNREVEKRRQLEHEAGVMLGFLYRAIACGNQVRLDDIRRGLARLGLIEHGRPGERVALSERGNNLLARCDAIEAKEKPMEEDPIEEILKDVEVELRSALKKHRTFPSAHHGHGVIQEELDELWAEVKSQNPIRPKMRHEAIQVAAAAVRFVLDLCDEDQAP